MQAGVAVADSVGSKDGESSIAAAGPVAVGGRISGLGVENEMLTTGLAVIFGLDGGTKRVGVIAGPQAASRNKNAQYEMRRAYFVLRSMGMSALFVPTAGIAADING